MGPAEGPAATQRDVEAETELVCPFGGEAEVGQEALRAEFGSGRRQRVDVGHLDSAETGVCHRPELALQLGSGH